MASHGLRRRVVGSAARGRPGTRRHACGDHLRCHATATCVRDPEHCQRPDGRRSSSSAPDCGPNSGAVHGTPAGRITEWKKNFCCVTTRRHNRRVLWWLRRGFGALTAPTLSLGVLGFGFCTQAPLRLPPRRLPAANLPPAGRILAVTLVATPRLVLPPAAFAQADPRTRSSRTGATGVLWVILAGAHGSHFSQGTARGERSTVLPGRLSKPGTRPTFASLSSKE
jgi:hypothetical protein